MTGAGITCIGIVSYSAVIAHWFEKRRGPASGVAVSGMGLGTFLLAIVLLTLSCLFIWLAAPRRARLGLG